jgi:CMP-N-acetylneuraminic acid synthetase
VTEVLALTVARTGSRRFPYKSLGTVGGKTLIRLTADACKGARTVTRMVFSTADEPYTREAINAGYELFCRPSETDTSGWEVACYTVQEMDKAGYHPDIVVMVNACNPFRRPKHIDSVVERYLKGDCRAVMTVSPPEPHPFSTWVVGDDGMLRRPFFDGVQNFESQPQLAEAYIHDGLAWASDLKVFLDGNCRPTDRIAFIPTTDIDDTLDINTEIDLKLAQFMWEKRQMEAKVA